MKLKKIFNLAQIEKNDLHILDTNTLKWTKINPKNDSPCIRGGTTLCNSGNKLYLHAGFSGKELSDFWVFDLDKLIWNELKPIGDIPSARSVHCLLPLKNGKHLFCFGGEKEPSTKGHEGSGLYHYDSFIYSIENNEWKELKPIGDIPSARGWFAATEIKDNNICIFGGFTGKDRTDELFFLNI